MVATLTAERLARDLIVYRELLSVALERLNEAQRQVTARDLVIERQREEIKRYTRERVQG